MSINLNSRSKWVKETASLPPTKSREVVINHGKPKNAEDISKEGLVRVSHSPKREEKERRRASMTYHT